MKKALLLIGLVVIMVIMLLFLFEIVDFNRYFLGSLFLLLAAFMLYVLVKKDKW
jgi:hypothetical protein